MQSELSWKREKRHEQELGGDLTSFTKLEAWKLVCIQDRRSAITIRVPVQENL